MRKRLGKTLADSLSREEAKGICRAFDVIGDIAITKLPSHSKIDVRQLAEAIMKRHKNIKALFVQEKGVHGDFRLRGLKHVAGENRTCTLYKESGCSFLVDLEKCYFSPRLSGERLRVAQQVQPGETVVNMFAGVGCFSIIIAKRGPVKVYSIDINPSAIGFMNENIRLNMLYGKVISFLGDSKEVVENHLQHSANRVLLPLPEKALQYLPAAISALTFSGGWIHYYGFEHARKGENPVEKGKLKVGKTLDNLKIVHEFAFSRVVRTVGPNWYQLVLDIRIEGAPHKS